MAKQDRWPELCELVAQDDGLPVRPCGAWTEAKLWLWNRYIEITTTAMVGKPQWSAGLVYVDLFAGPGVCLREDGKRLPGSALLAAKAPKPFRKIICTEQDVQLAAACGQRLGRLLPATAFAVKAGDCNELVQWVSDQIPVGALTLAFVDPEGFDIQFRTLEAISRNRAVDFLMLFADSIDLDRNVVKYIDDEGSKLDRFFGHGDWRLRLLALEDFGEGKLSKAVRELLEAQMRSRLHYAGFDYKTIKGPRGKLYDLIFASKHPTGLEFFQKIKKLDYGGQGQLF